MHNLSQLQSPHHYTTTTIEQQGPQGRRRLQVGAVAARQRRREGLREAAARARRVQARDGGADPRGEKRLCVGCYVFVGVFVFVLRCLCGRMRRLGRRRPGPGAPPERPCSPAAHPRLAKLPSPPNKHTPKHIHTSTTPNNNSTTGSSARAPRATPRSTRSCSRACATSRSSTSSRRWRSCSWGSRSRPTSSRVRAGWRCGEGGRARVLCMCV